MSFKIQYSLVLDSVPMLEAASLGERATPRFDAVLSLRSDDCIFGRKLCGFQIQ